MSEFVRKLPQLVIALIFAAVAWALVGYLATAPLGAIYGWSGHPAIPAAPWSVYVVVYFILLPVVCIAGAWYVASRLVQAISGT